MHNAKPPHYQRSKPNQSAGFPHLSKAKGFSKKTQQAWHKGNPGRDGQGRRAQRPPQASGYDVLKTHKTEISLSKLFAQIKRDLQRRDPRLKKNLDALCAASYLPDFNFISVSRAFNMLSRFSQNDPNRCDAIKKHMSFLPRMMQVAQQQMQDNLCGARGFASLLYGCMNLCITPDKAWQTIFWQHSQEQLGNFNPQDYSNTLYAAAKLSLEPSADWQQAFWAQSQLKLEQFNPQGLSNTLYAAAKLSLELPEDWQQTFWAQSQLKLKQFKPQNYRSTLYASCVLALKIPETCKDLIRLNVARGLEEDMKHLHAMYSASDYLEAQGINLVFKEGTLAQLQQNEQSRASHLENKTGIALSKVLQDRYPQAQLTAQHFIEATANTVDFFIEACGDQILVIQVDGPSHFLNKGTEKQSVDGFTAFQTRRLQDKGYQVLRLPYDLLDRHGVYSIKNENSPVPETLIGYLNEQLSPYIPAAT